MTSFPHPLLSPAQGPFGTVQLQEALIEPLLVMVVGLFWLFALPIGAVFSITVVFCHRLATLRLTALRLPFLRGQLATSPLVLRRRGFVARKTSLRSRADNQTALG